MTSKLGGENGEAVLNIVPCLFSKIHKLVTKTVQIKWYVSGGQPEKMTEHRQHKTQFDTKQRKLDKMKVCHKNLL